MHLHFSARPLTFGFFILGCIAGGFLCLVLVWWDTLHLQLLKAKAMSESGSFASEPSQFKCTDIPNLWWQSNTNGNNPLRFETTKCSKQRIEQASIRTLFPKCVHKLGSPRFVLEAVFWSTAIAGSVLSPAQGAALSSKCLFCLSNSWNVRGCVVRTHKEMTKYTWWMWNAYMYMVHA